MMATAVCAPNNKEPVHEEREFMDKRIIFSTVKMSPITLNLFYYRYLAINCQ